MCIQVSPFDGTAQFVPEPALDIDKHPLEILRKEIIAEAIAREFEAVTGIASVSDQTPDFFMKAVRDMSGY